MTALANALQAANLGSGSDQGYRHLKPKKDLQKITAGDAKTLMIELADFEVDLGELEFLSNRKPPTDNSAQSARERQWKLLTWSWCEVMACRGLRN